ncbi:hypothetical protein [Halomonas denitrificans]|nr:hypothetical protein [Halomonas denitrificans]
MARRNETLLDVVRALAFATAVVAGGIVIGVLIERSIGPPGEAVVIEETGEDSDLPRPD